MKQMLPALIQQLL
jgi:hypothetical protein